MTLTAARASTAPELIAAARVASLGARGIKALSRPWDAWLVGTRLVERPWLIVVPEDLALEIVFDRASDLEAARRPLLRLLADRWRVSVRVDPDDVPTATRRLSDLPIRIGPWNDM